MLLDKHTVRCHQVNKCAVRLPSQDENVLQFSHYSNKIKVPFAIYADIESILMKCDGLSDENRNTKLFQKHIPFSIAFYLKCAYDDSLSKFLLYRGADCVTWFINQLRSIAIWADNIFNNPLPMEQLSAAQLLDFENATHCHICEKPFLANEIRCHDHCHFSSQYRGPSHQKCNVNYKDTHVIPVVFHNLSGYDAHFLISELATGMPGQIKILPLNKEKYISFTKYVENTNVNFRFIDSFRFMSSSIEKLSSYLGNDKKTITRSQTGNETEFNLLTRKGVFPYEYIDSWEKLDEAQLPAQHHFFSFLTNDGVSDQDYKHALNVWNSFSIKTLGQYSDLYLKTDVLLLADIFENFRYTCQQTYKLDPLHYYTAPGLAFDAMLKITEVKLELLTDIDQVMFVEKGIRGGITQCSTRYAKANNKYMNEGYRPDLESIYLVYFDVNALYGATMCEFLPYGEFCFLDHFDTLDIFTVIYHFYLDEGIDDESFKLLDVATVKEIIIKAGPRLIFLRKFEDWKRLNSITHLEISQEDAISLASTSTVTLSESNVTTYQPDDELTHILEQALNQSISVSPPVPSLKSIFGDQGLEGILKANPEGKIALLKKGKLSNDLRHKISKIVINYFISNAEASGKKEIRASEFLQAAEEIVRLFPQEEIGTYYTPYSAPKQGLRRQPARGMLYSRYVNVKAALRLVCSEKRLSCDSEVEIATTSSASDDDDLNFISKNVEPISKVFSLWEQSFPKRAKYLKEPLDTVFEKFPALKCQYGLELVRSYMIIINFVTLDQDCEVLLCLSTLFSPTTVKKGSTGSYRPTRVEVQESFFFHVENFGELEQKIEHIRSKLEKYKLPFQPVGVVVGAVGSKQFEYYIVLNEVQYKVDGGPVRCLELLYKIYHGMNLEYPVESKQVWEFLQEMVFKTKLTTKSSGTSSVITDITYHLSKSDN
ncbi:hypothetical protein PPYR_15022 [Photinus pyralis]|uniref:DNA-directed DNA polymerase n=2 Tax=Photinus pyralis TaxID=7054 RepID=A0A5N3ZZT3_PHOPY|nr:hypothetical protein PPYR_15022 [Photinus pyralis]